MPTACHAERTDLSLYAAKASEATSADFFGGCQCKPSSIDDRCRNRATCSAPRVLGCANNGTLYQFRNVGCKVTALSSNGGNRRERGQSMVLVVFVLPAIAHPICAPDASARFRYGQRLRSHRASHATNTLHLSEPASSNDRAHLCSAARAWRTMHATKRFATFLPHFCDAMKSFRQGLDAYGWPEKLGGATFLQGPANTQCNGNIYTSDTLTC